MKSLALLFLISLIHCGSAFCQLELAEQAYQTKLSDFSYGKENNKVELKLYLPKEHNAPTILLSHGLGGSKENNAYLAKYWAARGYLVIAMQHVGSDRNIFKGKPYKQWGKIAKKAANFSSFLRRTRDTKATIDQLSKWTKTKGHLLHQRTNLDKLAMAGYSYGAITSQALTGQNFPLIGQTFTDDRIKAAFTLSPFPALTGSDSDAFAEVSKPWLLITGTKDYTRLTPTITVKRKTKIFDLIPKSTRTYLLVLKNATHLSFNDLTLRGKPHKNRNHHLAIQKISTAFFQSHLNNDKMAKNWLRSKKVKSTLQSGDSWKWK